MIKNFLIIISLLISSQFYVSCNANTKKIDNIQNINKNYKFERIEGLVEVKGQNVYIVVNPDCKCRKSYKVLGDKKEKLKKLKGLFVEVEGFVKDLTPWSAEILVKKIHILEK